MNSETPMSAYYNERASEYDELYQCGGGPASIDSAVVYTTDVENILDVLKSSEIYSTVADIPCGTGFWMQGYAENASSIILLDQSEKMLEEANKRAIKLGYAERITVIHSDLSTYPTLRSGIRTVIIGFYISHLTNEEEKEFWRWLKKEVAPLTVVYLLDGSWSPLRSLNRSKESTQIRKLNNGKEFPIYKRYFDRDDLNRMGDFCGCKATVLYFGDAFFIARLVL